MEETKQFWENVERQRAHLQQWAANATREELLALADENIKIIQARHDCDYLSAVQRFNAQFPNALRNVERRPSERATYQGRQTAENELHGRVTELQQQAGVTYIEAFNHLQHEQPLPADAQHRVNMLQAAKRGK